MPEKYLESLKKIPTWDDWDPDNDRWYFDYTSHGDIFSGGLEL